MAGLDLETIRHALEKAREMGYLEVGLEADEEEFQAKLLPNGGRPSAASPPAAEEPTDLEPSEPLLAEIKALAVGYYKASKTPLEPGRRVQKGDTVAVLSALNLNSDIESPLSGEVVEVLVKPDQPVMYGQVLARVRVDA